MIKHCTHTLTPHPFAKTQLPETQHRRWCDETYRGQFAVWECVLCGVWCSGVGGVCTRACVCVQTVSACPRAKCAQCALCTIHTRFLTDAAAASHNCRSSSLILERPNRNGKVFLILFGSRSSRPKHFMMVCAKSITTTANRPLSGLCLISFVDKNQSTRRVFIR